MGAADGAPLHVGNAERAGELFARDGWVVLTGGRPFGVMEAALRGAKKVAGSLTIGILPTAAEVPSPFVDVAIRSDMGHARNNVNVLTSDVVIACGVEGPGTTSEVALALKNDRPVILIAPDAAARAFFSDLGRGKIRMVATPEEALQVAVHILDSR
jgi:uncharacterized protein (TIGR00725 family)